MRQTTESRSAEGSLVQPYSFFSSHRHIPRAALIAMPTPLPAGNVAGTPSNAASAFRSDDIRTCTQPSRTRMWRAD